MKRIETKREKESDDLSIILKDYFPSIIANLLALGLSQRDIVCGLDLTRRYNVPQRTAECAVSKARRERKVMDYMRDSPYKEMVRFQRKYNGSAK